MSFGDMDMSVSTKKQKMMKQVIFVKSQMQDIVQKLESYDCFDDASLLEEIIEAYSKFSDRLLQDN